MPELTASDAYALALRFFRSGQLEEAGMLCDKLIAHDPGHAEALHLRGILHHQAGRPAEAISLVEQAIARQPGNAEYHNNLAEVYRQAGHFEAALAACRTAIKLTPGFAGAHNNLGVILLAQGNFVAAVEAFQAALRLQPRHASAQFNLGVAQEKLGRWGEALAAYRATLVLDPAFVAAHVGCGMALLTQEQLAAAESCFREAIRLKPELVEAWFYLGCVLEKLNRPDDAVAAYRSALKFNPQLLAARLNLGQLLILGNQLEAARKYLESALAIAPGCAPALTNLGNICKGQGDLDQALHYLREAVRHDPNNATSHGNLLYTLWFHPDYDETKILAEHRAWQERHAAPLARRLPHTNKRDAHRRLRIGYVSPFFTSHVVGWNVLPLMRGHDRDRFEIYCYSDVVYANEATEEFGQLSRWCECSGVPDAQLAARIESDEIDILVDLTLHMAWNRLLVFARQPAPVQVTFAGYPGTTGLPAIQYRLSDVFLDPPEQPTPYVEETIRLPSFWCYQSRPDDPEVSPLPALATGHITFGCLNTFAKVTPRTLQLWSEILRAVPGSRLILLAAEGEHRHRTIARLAKEGVAADRIEFVGRESHRGYLATYQRIDLALDTLPYNGHTTSCDALWMGVPVVSLVGATIVGRAGVSQLTNLGLTELIARSESDYVRLVTELAQDRPRLATLRSTLRARMQASPLMDAVGFTRAIESAYREMWQRWCASAG